ncbi:GntR family transcriptional regulator [Coraliomargarita parva]|uniref:GntR family transcriptional regulator n=1 Tax=Coraliomargarita parva TaxID=3014050 RepID=UPI0022B51AEB|nr:GntR family transcriptional regulator [Coraliomargarita parva]
MSESIVSKLRPSKAQLKKIPKEHAIRDHLREQILQTRLQAGAALPSMQEIAQLWESNYFTIHRALTPLVKEGLLVRHKGVGTFVADAKPKLETVGIYYGSDIISDPRHGYAIQLHRLLYQELKRKGLKIHTWLEPREMEEAQSEILPEVKQAAELQKIQALVTIMTTTEVNKQMQSLPLPVVQFSSAPKSQNVYFPVREFLTLALQRASEKGYQTIGFITSPSLLLTYIRKHNRSEAASFSIVQKLCAKAGLETRPSWYHSIDSGKLSQEEEKLQILDAYRKLQGKGKQKPDVVLIFPDNNLVTLQTALEERQENCHPELKIISHRNDPLAFPMPQGPYYIATSLKSVAEGLVKQVVDASEGRPCPSIPADLTEFEAISPLKA